MLNHLKKLNKNIAFYDIFSEEFSEYGRVIDDIDVSEIMAEAKAIPYPESGSAYLPSVKSFEATDAAKKVKEAIFGALDTQMGYCYGHNDRLNATEWHFSSELNIALTPLVLILGKRSDIKEWRIDSTKMKAFYVPQGAVIDVYATTLHFCPCQVSDSGFGCVVGLPLGTNTPLDAPVEDKLLFRKNKWLLAHEDNEVLIGRGAAAGICGENYTVRY